MEQEMLTFEGRVLCGNPLELFGSGLKADPQPTREFGPVANTHSTWQSNWIIQQGLQVLQAMKSMASHSVCTTISTGPISQHAKAYLHQITSEAWTA